MKNQLQLFLYKTKNVRAIIENGKTWFVLKDICEILELTSPHKVAERLDEDERNLIPLTDNLDRIQNTTVINESGLYAVILRSDKPQAKSFRKWVTSDVLPQIRTTGAYVTAQTITNKLPKKKFEKLLSRAYKIYKDNHMSDFMLISFCKELSKHVPLSCDLFELVQKHCESAEYFAFNMGFSSYEVMSDET